LIAQITNAINHMSDSEVDKLLSYNDATLSDKTNITHIINENLNDILKLESVTSAEDELESDEDYRAIPKYPS
jgi:hypothetical protein